MPNAKPPTSEFIEKSEVRKERAEIYDIAIAAGLPVSKKAMAEELAITLAADDEPDDVVQRPAAANPFQPPADNAELPPQFARGTESPFPDQDSIDAATFDGELPGIARALLEPLVAEFRAGVDPAEIEAKLASWYPKLGDAQLQELLARAMFVGDVLGRLAADGER